MTIGREYITLSDGRQVHCRRAGQGPRLLMLHPSPLSSAFLEPLIAYLATDFEVLAPDTPGYGDSDPLDVETDGLDPYVDVLAQLLGAVGWDRALVYGNATGAQLAIELAKAAPAPIAGLVLENAAAFTDAERAEMLGPYFPDLDPKSNGDHLALAWQMARQTFQFFPWYDTSSAARVSNTEPPQAAVHAMAMAYLKAGPDYSRAYRAAFANERPEQLAAVSQAARIILWADSILLIYSRRLQQASLPPNIEFVEADAGMDARYATVKDSLLSLGDQL